MKFNTKKIWFWVLGLTAISLFFGVTKVLAANVDTGITYGSYTGLVDTDPRIIVAKIIRIALGLLGVVALGLIIYGGFEYMTAAGNEEKVAQAKKILVNTAIGLAIILSSLAITQFIISKLGGAILNDYCSQTPTPVDCNHQGPPEPPLCTGLSCDIFYATSTPHGSLPIKNVVVYIKFYRGLGFSSAVDTNTVPTNIKIFKQGETETQTVAGHFEYLDNNTIIAFHPDGSCADADLGIPAGNSDCFEKNTTYNVLLKTSTNSSDPNSLRDTLGRALDCDNHSCQGTFTTGDKVDMYAPNAVISEPAQPAFVEDNYQTHITASYTDDVSVSWLRFKVSSTAYNVGGGFRDLPVDVTLPVDPLQPRGSAEHVWTPILSGARLTAEFAGLRADVYDLDNHSTTTIAQAKILPAHCWNGRVDTEHPEWNEVRAGVAHLVPDCGANSQCGGCAGDSCQTSFDCAGSYCDPATHVCVERPKILSVNPVDGKEGTYVTIQGIKFGSTLGKIYFDAQEADVVSCTLANPVTKSWTQFAVIAKAPAGSLGSTHSIELRTAQYSTSAPLQADSTNDDWGWNGFYTYTNQERPGLSCLNPATGPPGAHPVIIAGFQLGTTGILNFGELPVDVPTWTASQLSGVVTPTLPPQILSVAAKVAGVDSNPLPFIMQPLPEDLSPHIDYLDPTEGPNGTYVTISGRNFGTSTGRVFFGTIQALPPANCDNTWSSTQIIVKVPSAAQLGVGDTLVKVQTNAGVDSNNTAKFTVNSNALQPGLCSIDPDNGPKDTPVTVKGDGLGGSGKVEYWQMVTSTPLGWNTPQSGQIQDSIPDGAKTGRIKVWTNDNNVYSSNSVNFKVQNCKEEIKKGQTLLQACGSSRKCCENGICINNTLFCAEELQPKFSVYGWSFSTGRLPEVPRVLEQCGRFCTDPGSSSVDLNKPCSVATVSTDCPSGNVCGLVDPSPSPWNHWPVSGEICVNAAINIVFSTPITNDGTTLTAANANNVVIITQCNDTTCTPISTTDYSVVTNSRNTSIVFPSTSFEFAPGTTYQVLVTTHARSNVAGAPTANMLPDSRCPGNAAYCFSFKTKDTTEKCKVGAVAVSPLVSTTSTLNSTTVDAYHLSALADGNLCLTLNPNNDEWRWNPSDATGLSNLTSSIYFSLSNKDSNSNSKVDPIQNISIKNSSTPVPQTITATWFDDPHDFANKIKGTAYLSIQPPRPEVSEFWPFCSTACINGAIGFKFNIPVKKASLKNVIIESCTSATSAPGSCANPTTHAYKVFDNENNEIYDSVSRQGTASVSGGTEFRISLVTGANEILLSPNTYYRVVIKGDDKSNGIVSLNDIPLLTTSTNPNYLIYGGQNSFSWIFKTKNDSNACDIDKVVMDPKKAVVEWVGDKAGYMSQGWASNDCSPNGQKLNSALYNWQWASGDTQVATVSDLDRGVRLGGSTSSSIYCGDGAVQPNKYETCDSDDSSICTPDCRILPRTNNGTNTCSNPQSLSCCGNGGTYSTPDANEECDLGTQNGATGSSCNNRCLTTTVNPISLAHCLATITPAALSSSEKQKICTETYHAIPICGNSAIEVGEECDNGNLNGTSGNGCSATCLNRALQFGVRAGQCGNNIKDVSNNEQCDGDPGCSEDCRIASVGDGKRDPFQFATAMGLSNLITDPVTGDKIQETTISATTTKRNGSPVADSANFVLKCGYTPIDSTCPPSQAGVCAGNGCGAGQNTCCFPRPIIESIDPVDPTGPLHGHDICPNVLITIKFNQLMDETSFTSSTSGFYNIILASSTPTSCPGGQFQVSREEVQPKGLWQKIKSFVRHLFGRTAEAFVYCEGAVDYTLKSVSLSENGVDKTQVSIVLKKPLEKNKSYKLIVRDYVKNIEGVSLNANSSKRNIDFSTGGQICKINKLSIDPNNWLFSTTYNNTQDDAGTNYDTDNTDSDKVLRAHTYFVNGTVLNSPAQELTPLAGVYSWQYSWSKMSLPNNPTDNINAETGSVLSSAKVWVSTTNPQNGMAQVGANIIINADTTSDPSDPTNQFGDIFSSTSTIQVYLCENPWPSKNLHTALRPEFGLGYFDADGSSENVAGGGYLQVGHAWTNLRLLYCRDSGSANDTSDDLPALRLPATLYHLTDPNDPIVKEFFLTFSRPTSTSPYPQPNTIANDPDSIGIRIYPNRYHLSLVDWYKSQPWIPIGEPAPAKVGNYQALQEGRTYYINGLNVQAGVTPIIFSNVYVISFSDNPTNETLNVVGQLLNNLSLNVDLWSSNADKIEPMYRDFTRLQDLQTIVTALSKYRENPKLGNGSYPLLVENKQLGTFLPGYTNSKWNSWQGVLGNLVGGALPIDPLNGFYGCGNSALTIGGQTMDKFEAGTCWNSQAQSFICPVGSHVYQYNVVNGTKVGLSADFELPNSWHWDHEIAGTCNVSRFGCVTTGDCPSGESCDYNSITINHYNACNSVIQTASTKCGACIPGELKTISCTPTDNPATVWDESRYLGERIQRCKNDCSAFEADPYSGLISWFKADNNTTDVLGANTASIRGGVSYVNGRYGQAFNFNGTDGYVETNTKIPTLTTQFSFSFWVNPAATQNSNADIFGNHIDSYAGVVMQRRDTGSTPNTFFWGYGYGTGWTNSGEVQLTPNVWQHVVVVKDSLFCSIYVNGVFKVQGPCTQPVSPSTINFSIGLGHTNHNRVFKGSVDDFRIYSRVLQPGDILDIFNNTQPAGCAAQGYCGDNKLQPSAEVCDDGQNNGKPGYCNTSCTGKNVTCGNSIVDSGKEICDSSFLSSLLHSGWCSEDNLTACSATIPCSAGKGTCLYSGAKYARQLEYSCSWDCQSWEFCGDKAVQQPYETCETGESCQVGVCRPSVYETHVDDMAVDSGTGTSVITGNINSFCENSDQCNTLFSDPVAGTKIRPVCNVAQKKCAVTVSLNGADVSWLSNIVLTGAESDTCNTDADCQGACTNFVAGKRYCVAPGERKYEATTVTVAGAPQTLYQDSTQKYSYTDTGFNTAGCNWDKPTSFVSASAQGVSCLPSAPITPVPLANTCGIDANKDGNYVDPGEDCDNGLANNGDAPSTSGIAYGQTKTFCSIGCKWEIISSSRYCGNSVIDTSISVDLKDYQLHSEVCDGKTTGDAVCYRFNGGGQEIIPQGCSSDCKQLTGCPAGWIQCDNKTTDCPEVNLTVWDADGVFDDIFDIVLDEGDPINARFRTIPRIATPSGAPLNNSAWPAQEDINLGVLKNGDHTIKITNFTGGANGSGQLKFNPVHVKMGSIEKYTSYNNYAQSSNAYNSKVDSSLLGKDDWACWDMSQTNPYSATTWYGSFPADKYPFRTKTDPDTSNPEKSCGSNCSSIDFAIMLQKECGPNGEQAPGWQQLWAQFQTKYNSPTMPNAPERFRKCLPCTQASPGQEGYIKFHFKVR